MAKNHHSTALQFEHVLSKMALLPTSTAATLLQTGKKREKKLQKPVRNDRRMFSEGSLRS